MRLNLTESELDVENIYASTVMITVALENGESIACSGVLIDPRLALTAAHCVCGVPKTHAITDKSKPRPDPPTSGGLVMDSSTCAPSATVTMVVYKQLTEMGPDRGWRTGRVRPHHQFKIVLGPQGHVLVNEADLAVIALDEAFNAEEVPPVPLAKSAANLSDTVTLAGFGPDSTNGPRGKRRTGKNTVAALEVSGKSFLVGQKGSHTLGGDSGGPCFRGGMLVGIATTSSFAPPVEFSEFTSTYFYRDWLNAEIASARKARPITASDAP